MPKIRRLVKRKRWQLWRGDNHQVLPKLKENSVHCVITDPPYNLASIVKRFGGKKAAPAKFGKDGSFKRLSTGFMGKAWDSEVAFDPRTWAHIYRVLKPGGWCIVFGGTRTSHRQTCAIEDAGFIILDQKIWLYGTGFPKSVDVAKVIDKKYGHHRGKNGGKFSENKSISGPNYKRTDKGEPITLIAKWQGFGTALKPAYEPITIAMKPREGTIVQNVLKHGTGVINIDACRIPASGKPHIQANTHGIDSPGKKVYGKGGIGTGSKNLGKTNKGRFPANVFFDGSDEVMQEFAKYGKSKGGFTKGSKNSKNKIYGKMPITFAGGYGDIGTISRFFYCAKANKHDRADSNHPTVKPLSMMRYLVKLFTIEGQTILDPFAGSGTTLEAAVKLKRKAIGIEQERQYCRDIRARMRTRKNRPVK